MRIESIRAQHFRSLDDVAFELHPRLTILLGPNGSGKTNTLEAISLLSVPRSFRGSRDRDMVAWQQDFTRVSGSILYPGDVRRELVFFVDGSGKTVQVDGQTQALSEFIGRFMCILFAPEDVSLLAGAPRDRRAFLDAHISLLSPSYLRHLLTYQHVLARRNRLLSRHDVRTDELEYWNEQQVEHGAAIMEARLQAIDQINITLPSSLALVYESSIDTDGAIVETFHGKQASLIDREMAAGFSMVGPQRDDWRLEFTESGVDVGRFGSRGQQRMGVIALKQSQLHIISNDTGDSAVLLLDDVLSELDAANQQLLIQSIGQQQCIITTASLSDIPDSLLADAFVYEASDTGWRRHD
jgi:DNA replication and repair protein RecF